MKNLFTPANAAILLIDHQQGTIKLAVSTPYHEIVHNTRALARTAVETGIPLVLTSSQETHFQGLLLNDLKEIAPEAYEKRVKRPGVVDAWTYADFRNAVLATGRKKLIMTALWTEVCLTFPTLDALRAGYEVFPVVDAVGGTSPEAHRVGLERIVQAGAQPISWVSLACELQRDWARTQTVADVVDIVLTSRLLKGV